MKLKLTFFILALLSFMGAKADVIPSSYYSVVGEGTYFIYDVTDQKFVGRGDGGSPNRIVFESTPTKTFTLATGENSGYTIRYDLTSTYMMYNHAGQGLSWGSDFWMDANGSTKKADWNFTLTSDNKYKISSSYSYEGESEKTGGVAKYLQGGVWATESEESAHEYALITLSSYYSYLASTTATIPASFYTTTPVAGNTYYLYSPYSSCFLYATSDRAGFQNTPAEVTLTANGDDFNIQFSNGKYLKYDAVTQGNTWANGTVGEAWAFSSFHGATGLFFIKHVTANSYLYARNSSANAWGGECWGTPETNNTRYGWALISADDYATWQNSYVLNETDAVGFSSTRDIYNVNPTVNRTMTANVWNTLVVPFDMAIPTGWTVKEPTTFADGTLTFGDASSIVAGKPYIVKPTSAVTSFSATGVTLKKDLSNTTVGNLAMTGTYEKITAIDYSTQDCYIIGIKDGVSSLYKVNSNVSLKPFRAYFTLSSTSGAKRISISFDGTEASEVKEILGNIPECNMYYNLAGQPVSTPTKGIYIMNGKKVLIK